MRTPPSCSASVAISALTLLAGACWAAAPPLPPPVRAEFVCSLPGEAMHANALAFSPDGRTLLASHGPNSCLRLWEVATWRVRAAPPNPRGNDRYVVYGQAVFLPDGRGVITVATGPRAHLWDLPTMKIRFEFAREDDTSPFLTLSADGRTAALAWPDRVALYDLGVLKRVGELRGHTAFIDAVAFSPDGKTLATGSLDKTMRLWDVADRKSRAVLRGHAGYVDSVAFSPCGRWVASAGISPGDEVVRVWDAKTGHTVSTWRLPRGAKGLAFTPCGRWLAVGQDSSFVVPGGRPGEVWFWDVALRRECGRLRATPNGVRALAFSSDGAMLAVADLENAVQLWRMPPRPAPPVVAKAKPFDAGNPAAPPKEVLAWWGDLAGDDAEKAYKAVFALAEKPDLAVALFGQKLRPAAAAAADRRRVAAWIDDLGDGKFEVRERASRGLEKLGEMAEPALRRAAAGPDAEVRRRAARLLARLGPPVRHPDLLRAIRSAEVLELIGTVEARRLLAWLATGAPEATLTREASASLSRLQHRPKAEVRKP